MSYTSISIDGVTYPSVKEAVRAVGAVGYTTAQNRINQGWDLITAITQPVDNVDTSVTVYGETHASISAACRAYDIRTGTVYDRMKRGWLLEDALSTPVDSRKARGGEVTVAGVDYPSLAAAAHAYRIEPKVVRRRIKNGWSLDDAVTRPVCRLPRGHQLRLFDVEWFKSYTNTHPKKGRRGVGIVFGKKAT